MVLCQGQGPDITFSKEIYYVRTHSTSILTKTQILLNPSVLIDHEEYFNAKKHHSKLSNNPTFRKCIVPWPFCPLDIKVCCKITPMEQLLSLGCLHIVLNGAKWVFTGPATPWLFTKCSVPTTIETTAVSWLLSKVQVSNAKCILPGQSEFSRDQLRRDSSRRMWCWHARLNSHHHRDNCCLLVAL